MALVPFAECCQVASGVRNCANGTRTLSMTRKQRTHRHARGAHVLITTLRHLHEVHAPETSGEEANKEAERYSHCLNKRLSEPKSLWK